MKALHFGAGNIGRGFIGLILSQNDYDVTFADVNEDIVNSLKHEQTYQVLLANDAQTTIKVDNVHAVHSIEDKALLEQLILEADLITTAVGVNVLPIIAKTIASTLQTRQTPVNIVACENAINATDQLKVAIESEVGTLNDNIHFSNAAVDRIVPMQNNKNILDVTVEPFYEWVIEASNWFGTQLKGIKYVDTLTPFIERKLLTVNTGHAFLAYAGQYYGHQTILEATKDKEILTQLTEVLTETSSYLINHFNFDELELKQYREEIINRFKNPYLSDDITRVGRGVLRKLGPNDRIIKPLNALYNNNQKYTGLLKLAAFALKYTDLSDQEAIDKERLIENDGLLNFLKSHSKINEQLANEIINQYLSL
ncbi:mannitol-1-phosphate 5-dehydrogenase [Staphylococcus canis]|uniref:Mannitol-1-phosphate 5-dehydrogenase n=1 Tax=Staphylococcus canis TaxID=2724942 RepID=A0ABS0TAX1_9STAP|nr:mannitol-1-phosphate 5-dehydrogenase [Staphylococcus canis]